MTPRSLNPIRLFVREKNNFEVVIGNKGTKLASESSLKLASLKIVIFDICSL